MLHTFSLSPICITIDNTRIPVELYKIYVGVTRYTVLRYIFIDYLSHGFMCLLSFGLNVDVAIKKLEEIEDGLDMISRIRSYTFTFESRVRSITRSAH